MRCPFRSVSIRPRLEVSFEDRLQNELECPLDHTITDRRNRKNADFLPPSFGISFFRARMGRYVFVISSSRICLKKTLHSAFLDGLERDPVNTRCPVILLAPSGRLRRSVSILQTWTYSPQKRQVGSAFALTYRLLLRSCKLMGAFVISPLPPVLLELLQTAGLLRSTDITPLHRYYRAPPTPSRLPPISRCLRLYGFPAPPISRRDEEGFSSCLAHPCHRAVASTPPEWLAASVSLRRSMLPSPYGCRLGLWGYSFSRPLLRSLSLRPDGSLITPRRWLCR